jgi:hypothetical protein
LLNEPATIRLPRRCNSAVNPISAGLGQQLYSRAPVSPLLHPERLYNLRLMLTILSTCGDHHYFRP